MRPTKKMPSLLLQAKSRRGPNSSRSRSLRLSFATLAPLLAVLATTLLTLVYFVAIRKHNVELSFKQLSTFQRQVQPLGNLSVYFVALPRRDEFLTMFSPDDWSKLSSRVDYVAFLYGDMNVFAPSLVWINAVTDAFANLTPIGYGIVLFSCGCVVPNVVFKRTHTRFDGYECTMLPGFVMRKESVAWINTSKSLQRCHHRDAILSHPWYETNAWKLQKARQEHTVLRKALSMHAT